MKLNWNAAIGGETSRSDFWSEGDQDYWNVGYDLFEYQLKGSVIYLTVTLDTSREYEKKDEYFKDMKGQILTDTEKKNGNFFSQKVYVNGTIVYDGDYSSKQWARFKTVANSLNTFCVGRSSMYAATCWNYSKMNTYCLRLYNRALSEGEVFQNYEKSIAYHSESQQS